jgi:hypothetical protein
MELDSRLQRILHGKRVALIATGRTLMGRRLGARICRDYDVICRINEVFPYEWEADYGNRTDVVFHSCAHTTMGNLRKSLSHNRHVAQSLQFVVACQRSANAEDNMLANLADVNRDYVAYGRDRQIPTRHVGDDFWVHIAGEVGKSPTSGTIAIAYILQHAPVLLTCFNFTFFREGNTHGVAHYPAYNEWGGEDYKAPSIHLHDCNRQEKWAQSMLAKHRGVLQFDSGTGMSLQRKARYDLDATEPWEPLPHELMARLSGKRVALVGPAPYREGNGGGEYLDGFDVIARVNEPGLKTAATDYGSRTDIIFHAGNDTAMQALTESIRKRTTLAGTSTDVCVLSRTNTGGTLPVHPVMAQQLAVEIGTSPNTGMLAAWLLLEYCRVAELHVTGFDWYDCGLSKDARHSSAYIACGDAVAHADEPPTGQSNRVNQDAQKAAFCRLATKFRDKVTTDTRLRSVTRMTNIKVSETMPQIVYAVYRAYYGEDYIEASIRSVAEAVDKVIVYWTDRAFGDVTGVEYGGEWIEFPRPADGMVDIVRDLAAELDNVTMIYDHFGVPDNQWRHLIARTIDENQTPDVIMCMETDMVWCHDQLRAALTEVAESEEPVMYASQVEFWKSTAYAIPVRPRPGPIFHRVSVGVCDETHKNALPVDDRAAPAAAICHNMGFAAGPALTRLKHLTALAFSATIGDSLPAEDWYEATWLAWDYETNNRDLEPSAKHRHMIPRADKYDGPIPETLHDQIKE